MPANIAHMLICHQAVNKLRDKKIPQLQSYIDFLNSESKEQNYKMYLNLGSMGPDLFYYSSLLQGVKDIIKDGFIEAKGVEPWSYHLHSAKPDWFPAKMIEIVFRDALRNKDGKIELGYQDHCKLAFIAGYLTHIAADQIIHPLVDTVTGPYYREGANRKKHRECEAFQDYYLYTCLYKIKDKSGDNYDFFKQDFNKWCDCITGWTFKNTHEWFRYFLQRAFAETYYTFPDEKIIEDSVDNLLLFLRKCNGLEVYEKAAEDFKQNGEKSNFYIEYIGNIEYLKYYRVAVELADVYLMALYEIFEALNNNEDLIAKKINIRFADIIDGSDLTRPLDKEILDNAAKKFIDNKKLLFKTQLTDYNELNFLTKNDILKMNTDTAVLV